MRREKKGPTMCANGCDAPVCPPSKVICRACMDRITANLEDISARFERRVQEAADRAKGEQ